jgi:lipopolysaccharide assembly outer membrane protein LptD (OstA)
MTYRSQKNSRIFEFYKKGLLTKVRHIHSFQLFPTLTVTLLSFFWAFGQDQSLTNTEKDSIATNDTIPQNKSMLLDQIKRNALGTITINRAKKTMTLYDEAELYYQNIELKAGQIDLDYNTNVVFARPIVDSTGQYIQYPSFKQGSDEVFPDSLKFNFNNKKAVIWNSKSQQQGMNVLAETTKKENDSVYYIKNARITTSEDVENPDYFVRIRKGKFVPQKKIIASGNQLYIADVPTPVFLPFAYFPMTQDRESGVIFPTIGENFRRGYFMQNGGYYIAASDYFDVALLGDYYTNGSYGFRVESSYNMKYKFRGKLSFRFENLISGERGFPGYSKINIYNLRWSHSKDSKSNPNSRFSASVNLGSSTYFRESLNQINTGNFLNNTLSSSVSYARTFPKYPSVNLSLSASHSQNTRTQTINMTLPTFQANMERIYPFAKRTGTKKGIIQNINFQYSVRGENRLQMKDEEFLAPGMFDNAKSGFKHQIPINTSFKVAKHFNFSVGGNYEDTWVFETIKKNDYDPQLESVAAQDTIRGFDRFNKYNYSAGVSTTLYGIFDFKEDAKIKSIRHVINANVSYSESPSFEKYYDEYIIDADGNTRDYTRFETSLYGRPGINKSRSMSFGLRNTIEAKVRDPDTLATEPKKIKILNNLNFSTSYNLEADSLRWSPVRMSTVIPLLDNKLNINLGATFDPYGIDENGSRINTLSINNGGGLFRMTSANMNWGYKFSSSSKSDDDSSSNNDSSNNNDLFGGSQDFSDRRFTAEESSTQEEDQEEEEQNTFYHTKIPWSINLRHSLTYSNARRNREISNNSLMVSGSVGLTPKWDVGISSGYDFKNKGITYTNFRIERDLDSWVMNLAWTPFGKRQSWYFFIGVRSGFLSDLKYEKRREPDRKL